ncbi:hypothetical protein LA080_001849 [Diaporthe eres]|nr:hypothetical protein LA080_001849 [Diaporthe eres]
MGLVAATALDAHQAGPCRPDGLEPAPDLSDGGVLPASPRAAAALKPPISTSCMRGQANIFSWAGCQSRNALERSVAASLWASPMAFAADTRSKARLLKFTPAVAARGLLDPLLTLIGTGFASPARRSSYGESRG